MRLRSWLSFKVSAFMKLRLDLITKEQILVDFGLRQTHQVINQFFHLA